MTPRNLRARRARPLVAAAAAAALGLSLAAPAQAEGETDAAVDWVDSTLSEGLVYNVQYEFIDVGLSIDVGLLALATGRDQVAQKVYDAVVPQIDGYVGGGEVGGEGEVYASSVAKAARFVQLSGGDPSDVGGRDLVADLEGLTDDSTGRIADQSGFGDFAATIGQSFAAASLDVASSPEADEALSFLLDQQCPGGGFREGFGGEGSTCSDDGAADLDVTALAVQLLAPLGLASSARSDAADFLEREQGNDGALSALGSDNSNTTGLAAYALGLEGRGEAARSAADFVRGLQVRAPGACTDVDEGAVAFDQAGFEGQKVGGISLATIDQFVRATAQAGLALDLVSVPSEDEPLTAVGTRAYVRAGSLKPVLVSGLAPRDTVCVSNRGYGVDEVGGIDGTSTLRVLTGRGTRVRTFTVADTYGRTTEVKMRVLGRKKFEVSAPNRRREGSKMRVVARGLASGEKATLFVAKGDVDTAWANRDGQVVFRAVDVLREPGRRLYRVRGKFGNIRKGGTFVRVLPRS